MFSFIFVQRRAILSFWQTKIFSHMQDYDSAKMINTCLLVKICFISATLTARHMCEYNFTIFLPDISDSSHDVVLYMLRTYLQTKEFTVFLSYQKLAGLSLVNVLFIHTVDTKSLKCSKHHHDFATHGTLKLSWKLYRKCHFVAKIWHNTPIRKLHLS